MIVITSHNSHELEPMELKFFIDLVTIFLQKKEKYIITRSEATIIIILIIIYFIYY